MSNQVSTKGGKKLRRCNHHSPSRKTQRIRTARNKIRRLTKRLEWDPTAAASIARIKEAK